MSEHDDEPLTRGGSKILRHGAAQAGWVAPAKSLATEEIERHMAASFGTPTVVLHEIVSHLVSWR